MKNQTGFIPKTWAVQPDYYSFIFNNWNAVFFTEDGEKFYLEIIGDFHTPLAGKEVEILRQTPECRVQVAPRRFPTIKEAYRVLMKHIGKETAA